MKPSNPLAFRTKPVVAICVIVYIALSAVLLYIGCTVPPHPKSEDPLPGLNFSEALADLQQLTNGFHPYNSRRNDEVRSWLLSRVGSILRGNGLNYATVQSPDRGPSSSHLVDPGAADAVIFNDLLSNASFTYQRFQVGALSTYFEGTNVFVYLRGHEDTLGAWWQTGKRYTGPKGVLVNAHYDSVSTGYGATDDGVGVITVLQLLEYFSSEGKKPKHGIIFLLNNGEEDHLNGARAFAQHPAAKFADRFLNLEGAGAGGKAALFRTTDTEVTRFYQGARRPFATSTSDDGFKAGFIRSETDYRVFYRDLGMRGLDVAFLEPRSRYHTVEDDARHTDKRSIWHMMSAALPTVQGLVEAELDPNSRTDAVWFDMFGRAFAVMELHTLFALQVTLLVIAPLSIFVIVILLQRSDKFYLFSRYMFLDGAKARMGGLKGLFRAPIIFAVASAATLAPAFLILKFNPFIATSSPWAVWACFMSAWIFVAWFLARFADYVRPTALQRVYSLAWLHLGYWVLAVAAAVYENQGLSSGYPILFVQLGAWLATLVALSELFAVTKKRTFASEQLGLNEEQNNGTIDDQGEDNEEEEANERTALIREPETSFRPRTSHTENTAISMLEDKPPHVYKYEQYWSEKLPSTLWVLEFLLVSIPVLIFIGPIVPFVTSALTQTLSDGGSLNIYIPMAILSILYVTPLLPFLHRFSYHVPIFLFLVFAGTLTYNLTAFPFSANNRLKIYFTQEVDLDTGLNSVLLEGADEHYLEHVIWALPSAPKGMLTFTSRGSRGLTGVEWAGLPPQVVEPTSPGSNVPPELSYEHWMNVTVERPSKHERTATITVSGRNTRNCKLLFDTPVDSFYVEGSATDNGPYEGVPDGGTTELRLWRRTWENPWTVNVTWTGQKGLDGSAVCNWNMNEKDADGGIPALHEIYHYAPPWIATTKAVDGLVEGYKRFLI